MIGLNGFMRVAANSSRATCAISRPVPIVSLSKIHAAFLRSAGLVALERLSWASREVEAKIERNCDD